MLRQPRLSESDATRARPGSEILSQLAGWPPCSIEQGQAINSGDMRMIVSCPCDAVHIRIGSEPIAQFWCHCADCQIVHGGAYVAEAVYPADGVEIVRGDTISFTLKTTPRVSCARCGTRLFAELGDIGMRGLNGYLLKDRFKPELHIYCSEAIAQVDDHLPHYRTKPAAFGGDDVLMEG